MSWRSFQKILINTVVLAALLFLSCLCCDARESPCSRLQHQSLVFIVPHSVGGGYDTYARLIVPFLAEALDAQIVIENRSGAGGTIGAMAIQEAAPDGKIIGILNGAGLMVKALAGGKRTPNPATDFTILARVVRNQQVWAVPADSPFSSIEDLLRESEIRPILFGMRDVGSTSFVNAVVTSHLLDMPIDVVAGYQGTQAKTLAALRGEVDVTVSTFETILPQIEGGEVRPVLQVATSPIDDHPSLRDVPLLGGEGGLVARRAWQKGWPEDRVVADADALVELLGAGRLIVAPPGMDSELAACLESRLLSVLDNPNLRHAAASAGRSLEVTGGFKAQAELRDVTGTARSILPVVEAAIDKVRQ